MNTYVLNGRAEVSCIPKKTSRSTNLLHGIISLVIQRLTSDKPCLAIQPTVEDPLHVLPSLHEDHEEDGGNEYDTPFPADRCVFEHNVVDDWDVYLGRRYNQ